MNVIKVTGNNRKAVLAFLEEIMPSKEKPSNKRKEMAIFNSVCYLRLEKDTWITSPIQNGKLTTLKAVKELYKPKETKAEKTQRSRAMMYKLKYEQLKGELSNVNKLNESQSIQIETLSASVSSLKMDLIATEDLLKHKESDLLDIKTSNKHLQKQVDTNQDLYMKEREKTVRLTELWEENEKEVQHLKREKTSMVGQIMQAEMENEDLLMGTQTANKTIQDYKRTTIALTIGIIALITTIWIG